MKQLTTILSVLAFVGVLILFALHFSGNKTKSSSSVIASGPITSGTSRLAFINIDTFEANYVVLKSKKEEFSKRQASMEAELQRSAQQMQNDYEALQRKAQTNSISQAEGEVAQKRLLQMQQSLETRKQAMTESFVKDQESFNNDLHKTLDGFLEEYNANKKYDFILSYSRSNPVIMYANKGLNITADVIKGMNERAAANNTTNNK